MAVCVLVGVSRDVSATNANYGREGGQETVLEYKLKAGFILNFIRFTQWQENTENIETDWKLCTFVQDDFLKILSQLNGKQVGLNVLKVYDGLKNDRTDVCDAVFIGDQLDEVDVENTLSTFKSGVLTIGTGMGFVSRGGHISIIPRGGRYGFFLNVGSAEQAGLRFSSKLRSLAVGEIASTRDKE